MDRELQSKILTLANNTHPESITPNKHNGLSLLDKKSLASTLVYLEEHGLIKPRSVIVSGGGYQFQSIDITHKGQDFLADDGGLSAILNVLTVRFEAETLKAIINAKINESDLSQEQKQSMTLALEELPAESIKHLTTKLLDECVDNLPAAVVLIGTWLGSF